LSIQETAQVVFGTLRTLILKLARFVAQLAEALRHHLAQANQTPKKPHLVFLCWAKLPNQRMAALAMALV